jgi:hypothetical protein
MLNTLTELDGFLTEVGSEDWFQLIESCQRLTCNKCGSETAVVCNDNVCMEFECSSCHSVFTIWKNDMQNYEGVTQLVE